MKLCAASYKILPFGVNRISLTSSVSLKPFDGVVDCQSRQILRIRYQPRTGAGRVLLVLFRFCIQGPCWQNIRYTLFNAPEWIFFKKIIDRYTFHWASKLCSNPLEKLHKLLPQGMLFESTWNKSSPPLFPYCCGYNSAISDELK